MPSPLGCQDRLPGSALVASRSGLWVDELNKVGIRTPQGSEWHLGQLCHPFCITPTNQNRANIKIVHQKPMK